MTMTTKRAAGHTAPGPAAPSRTSLRPPTARRDSRPPERVLGTAREAGNPAAAGECFPAAAGPVSREPGAAGEAATRVPAALPPSPARVAGEGGTMQLAAAMSEDQLDHAVRRILKDLPGVLAYHTHDSRRSHRGLPDWIFASGHGVMWRELKTERGALTAAQRAWLDVLVLAGQDAGVWRPSSLLSGQVARELAVLAGMRLPPGGESP